MAPNGTSEGIYQGVLVNYLIAQARTVEGSVNRALRALIERNDRLASEVFLTEPRINEMEIVIDKLRTVRALRQGNRWEPDVRLIVATLKINNDLERMGDLAVNLSERAVSLAGMGSVQAPPELEPMTTAVRAMVSKCLGALIYQNVELATQVLESDDIVDQHRDQVFDTLLAGMTENPAHAAPNLQFVLASRSLERIADHTTNIAEDVLFWVRGLEVRHGRARQIEENSSTWKQPPVPEFGLPKLGHTASLRSFRAVHRLFNQCAYSQAACEVCTLRLVAGLLVGTSGGSRILEYGLSYFLTAV